MSLALLGVISVVLVSISDLSYVYAIWKGRARPHRITWFILLLTASVAFGSQWLLGARTSMFIFGWFVIINATIFLLSMLPGKGEGGANREDMAVLSLAILSIVLWVVIDSRWALMGILTADSLGIYLTAKKAWRDPFSEPRLMWGLGSVAGVFSVLAVGSLDFFLWVAPVHFLACDLLMISIILMRRKQFQPVPA